MFVYVQFLSPDMYMRVKTRAISRVCSGVEVEITLFAIVNPDVYNFLSFYTRSVESLELLLEETNVTNTETMTVDRFVALLHKPKGPFKGLEIHANGNEVRIFNLNWRPSQS